MTAHRPRTTWYHLITTYIEGVGPSRLDEIATAVGALPGLVTLYVHELVKRGRLSYDTLPGTGRPKIYYLSSQQQDLDAMKSYQQLESIKLLIGTDGTLADRVRGWLYEAEENHHFTRPSYD